MVTEPVVVKLSDYTYERSNWRDLKKSIVFEENYTQYQQYLINKNLKANQQKTDSETNDNYAKRQALDAFWSNFNNRQRAANLIAWLYGGLQGWGMAGFVLTMMKDVEIEPEVEWAIALAIALPVALVNMWLVRPELESYIGFEKYKKLLNGDISTKAIFITAVSSILLGGVVAFGITSSLPTKDTEVIAPVFGLMTAVLAFAEGLLNIGSLDEILKTSFSQKLNQLRKSYTDENAKTKATAAFYGVFVTSCIGMIGIALVGSKALANQVWGDDDPLSLGFSSFMLLLAASAQIPFYQDRALNLAKRWFPTSTDDSHEIAENKLVFNPENKLENSTQKFLWAANGILNAPCAYLGVVITLGKFAGLEKMKSEVDIAGNTAKFDNHNWFEQIFFQYGNSVEASIIYGIGALFFIAAVGISMAANSQPPEKIADPKGEHEVANKLSIT